MRKVLFIGLLFILILSGCNQEVYNNSIQKGLDFIASEEFKKAEGAFEIALSEKKQDERAAALLEQTRNYQDALQALEEGDLDLAANNAEKVTKETEGSEALIKKTEEIYLLIEDFQTTYSEITEQNESVLQLLESEEYEKAAISIEEILTADLSHMFFQSLSEDVENLKKDIETALIAQEKAEREAAEKERAAIEEAEREKVAKEEAARAAAEETKEQENKREETVTANISADDALAIIKNLGTWSSTTSFSLDAFEMDGVKYHYIYVEDAADESYSSKVHYLVHPVDGTVYDYSRGSLAPLN
ncbi:hypothetical protein [Evansella clarkii]|uniref:hypothetical protein n=1 Tax=Evansella clarkii TaxID=79879 RepID=UPI000B43BDAB|nr:hypothetical protein [Evansella clarkii]